jgi:hypothetical protein
MEALAALGIFAFIMMLAMTGIMIAGIVLWIWALADVVRAPGDYAFKAGSKLLWAIVVGLGGPMGALIYMLVGRLERPQPRRAF